MPDPLDYVSPPAPRQSDVSAGLAPILLLVGGGLILTSAFVHVAGIPSGQFSPTGERMIEVALYVLAVVAFGGAAWAGLATRRRCVGAKRFIGTCCGALGILAGGYYVIAAVARMLSRA